MKNVMKLAALMAVVSMAVCGCGGSTAAETTAAETETTAEAAVETETAAEGESAEEGETEAASSSINFSEGLDDDGMLTVVSSADYVTLPDYKNAELSQADLEVTDQEIQDSIDSILQNFSETKEVTDRAIVDGDVVNIDYVGTIDGVAFEGGDTQGSGADLTIGSQSYIDTFEEQLIGHKPGENVTVKVTFPEDYGKDELNGKAAEFAVTINHIKEEVLPELTDAFVAENLKESYDVDTVQAMKDKIADALKGDKEYAATWAWLTDNCEFTQSPDPITDSILNNFVDTYKEYATSMGVDLDTYLAYYGIGTEEDLRAYYRENAEEYAKRYVITDAICRAENMVCDEAVLNEYFDGQDYSEYTDFYGNGYVKMQVNFSKVSDFVLENATIK